MVGVDEARGVLPMVFEHEVCRAPPVQNYAWKQLAIANLITNGAKLPEVAGEANTYLAWPFLVAYHGFGLP